MATAQNDLQLSITATNNVRPGLTLAQNEVASAARSMRSQFASMGSGAGAAGRSFQSLGERMRMFAREQRQEASAARFFVGELAQIVPMAGNVKAGLVGIGSAIVGGMGLATAIGLVTTGIGLLTEEFQANEKQATQFKDQLRAVGIEAEEMWAKVRGDRGPKTTQASGLAAAFNAKLQKQIEELEKERDSYTVGGARDFFAPFIPGVDNSQDRRSAVEGQIQALKSLQINTSATGTTESKEEVRLTDAKLKTQAAILEVESMEEGIVRERALIQARLLERLAEIDREYTGLASPEVIDRLKGAEVAKAGREQAEAEKKAREAATKEARENAARMNAALGAVEGRELYDYYLDTLGGQYGNVKFAGDMATPALADSERVAAGAEILSAADASDAKAVSKAEKLSSQIAATWTSSLAEMVTTTDFSAKNMSRIFSQMIGQMISQLLPAQLGPFGLIAGGLLGGLLGGRSKTPSAAGGWWQVPHDTLAYIHKDEKVWPADKSRKVDRLLESGSSLSGGMTVHVAALDGVSVYRTLTSRDGDVSRAMKRMERRRRA